MDDSNVLDFKTAGMQRAGNRDSQVSKGRQFGIGNFFSWAMQKYPRMTLAQLEQKMPQLEREYGQEKAMRKERPDEMPTVSPFSDDEKEVKKAFKVAGRKVKVQFLNLPDKDLVNKIKNLDSKEVPLDSIYNVLWGGNAPVREITWFDRENDYIHNSLFDENIEKGNMLGPYETEDNTYIIMKVLGWTDEIKITESER